MVVPGTLNDLARSLGISVGLAGQLFAIGAATVCFGAPLLAGWVAGFDRRRLLAASLVGYAAGHAVCAAMPSYAALWPVRAVTMLGAAVFTPQAAAAVGFLAPPAQRGRAIGFIFLGWSMASVLGLPLSAWSATPSAGAAPSWPSPLLARRHGRWVFATMPTASARGALAGGLVRAFTSPLADGHRAVTALTVPASSRSSPISRPTCATCSMPRRSSRACCCSGSAPSASWQPDADALHRPLRRRSRRADIIACIALAFSPGRSPPACSRSHWPSPCGPSAASPAIRCSRPVSLPSPALASALLALNTSAIYLGQAAAASSGRSLIALAATRSSNRGWPGWPRPSPSASGPCARQGR